MSSFLHRQQKYALQQALKLDGESFSYNGVDKIGIFNRAMLAGTLSEVGFDTHVDAIVVVLASDFPNNPEPTAKVVWKNRTYKISGTLMEDQISKVFELSAFGR